MQESSDPLKSPQEPVPIDETTFDDTPHSQTRSSTSYVGLRFGKYHVITQLGRGAMGEVWKAWDTVADRHVVIKTVPQEVGQDADSIAEIKANFQQVHLLQHQHICPVYGLEYDDRCGYFLVMKFIEGKTLKDYLKAINPGSRRLPLPTIIGLLKPVATALDYSHSQLVIHRDVKPDNVMVTPEGDVQVVDFGIS
ncbi:MAG: serine/threonine protein kinase, partial [Planctomycetaceae bacterium]|nr:serine/threonine protein kinase [Planctomycetaceae bacterium]